MFGKFMYTIRASLSAFVLGVALLATSGTAKAVTLDFEFKFQNVLNGGGTVTGIVRGLMEGTGAAPSVEILSNTAGFGLGEYVGNPTDNSWTVVGGVLTAFNFYSFGISNTAPAVTDSTLFFDSSDAITTAGPRAGLQNSPDRVVSGNVQFTPQDIALTFTPVAPIPLPASLPLLAAAVLGLGAFRIRCRKQLAA